MHKDIIFTNFQEETDFLEKPQPALNLIPDWYKEIDSYMGKIKKPDGQGRTMATIKKCMPVFDCIGAGYLILLPTDLWVSIDENGKQFFEWPSIRLVSFHPIDQAPNHPAVKPFDYPKFLNPWGIKTPRGYSTLFVQPFHRESVFTIMPGIVDTDKYSAPVNFPFVINDPKFEGLISKGTPIAQVIPFKRDSWKMKTGNKDNIKEITSTVKKLRNFIFDSYKNQWRVAKDYK